VVVFADTFTNFYEPEIGIAAVDLMRAAGVEVVVGPRVCCGRPLISKGFLDEARHQAEASVRALYPLARDGTPIVFLEPSCYSAVRDDHPHLLRGELKRQAEVVASCCLTFEEWAARAFNGLRPVPGLQVPGSRLGNPTTSDLEPETWTLERAEGLPFQAGPPEVLLHAHCHQRALVGTGPAMQLLSAIPGWRVTDLDSGCCGMAGSFGYEREHFDLSRQVGEHRLFPAVRAKATDAVVVASGFSCRHQIRDFTGVEAMHPAVLLRSLLAG
jgi:Fe-S oxidoreductase